MEVSTNKQQKPGKKPMGFLWTDAKSSVTFCGTEPLTVGTTWLRGIRGIESVLEAGRAGGMTELASHGDLIVEPKSTKIDQSTPIRLLASSNPLIDGLVVDLRSPEPIVLPNQRHPWQLRGKRAIDVVASIGLLILFFPLLVATALAIAVTSPGPVLHRQRRVGLLGQEFQLLKFRSMYIDAEERRAELDHLNHHTSGPIFKIKNDPRITPVGRVVRRLTIDELPQLLHVLSGKMSLVGPRPPLPGEVHQRWSDGAGCLWSKCRRSVSLRRVPRSGGRRLLRPPSLPPDERVVVKQAISKVQSPRRLGDLIRRKTCSYAGLIQAGAH